MSGGTDRQSIQKQLSGHSSVLSKYRSTMVDDGGNFALLLYELVNLLFIPLPSKIGMWLRNLTVGALIGKMGRSVCIGANCTIRNSKKIFIGNHVCIGDKVTLDVKPGKNKLVLGDHSTIGRKTILNCAGGELNVGEKTVIESHCRLGSLKGLKIGRQCQIHRYCCIVGAGHATDDLEQPIVDQSVTCKGPNFVGDSVNIGERVTILDGVRIGSNVCIHADSLVIKDVPDDCEVTGVPAEII